MTGNTLRTGGQPTANEPLQVPTVRLIDCQGLTYAFERATSASAGVATHPVATKYEALPVTGGVITLFYPDGSRAMMVEFPYSGPIAVNGFEIIWESKYDCTLIWKAQSAETRSDNNSEKSATRPVTIPRQTTATGGEKPKDKTGDNEKPPFDGKGVITFVNCEGYMTMLQFQGQTEPTLQRIPSNGQEVRVRMTEYDLYSMDGKTVVLHINLNDPRICYRTGDFEVRKTSEAKWTVVTLKPNKLARAVDFFTSKLGLCLIVLLVILGGGAWAYFALFNPAAVERTLYVTVDNGEKVDGIEIVKPGALNMRSSGNTLTITFKGDTLEFAGNEVVRIDFGPEGKIGELRVMELVGATNYVFKNNMDSVTVTKVQTPAYELYARIIEDEPIDTMKVEAFRNMYAESKYNQDLAEKVTAQKAAEADAEAKSAELAKVKALYNALIAKLGNMNVTKADLDRVIAYQNEHKDELKAEIAANRAKVRAYKSFFDPSQSFKKDIKYFSSAQQQACKYYFYIKGNDPKRDFNYALKKAMEMGLVD